MSPTSDASPQGHGVDLDLLADCLEGVLSDARTRTVLDLVASDPVWAATYAALAEAQPAVHATITGYAASTEPMPTGVSDRIADALRKEARQEKARSAEPASLDAARKRRTARLASNGWVRAAVAASIVGVVGLGAAVSHNGFQPGGTSKSTGATSNDNRTASGPESAGIPLVPSSTLVVSASGQDYTAQTLGAAVRRPSAITTFGPSSKGVLDTLVVPGDLNRLTTATALEDCLSAIVAVHGGTPTAVDYAAYAGQPALIVTLAGANLVVAVADRCGLAGVGADEVGSAPRR